MSSIVSSMEQVQRAYDSISKTLDVAAQHAVCAAFQLCHDMMEKSNLKNKPQAGNLVFWRVKIIYNIEDGIIAGK